jgi:hypothetical protein
MSVSSPEQEKEKHRAPATNQLSNRLFPGKQSLSSIIIGNFPQSGNRRRSLGKKETRMSTIPSVFRPAINKVPMAGSKPQSTFPTTFRHRLTAFLFLLFHTSESSNLVLPSTEEYNNRGRFHDALD